jgi:hypothetical protein
MFDNGEFIGGIAPQSEVFANLAARRQQQRRRAEKDK